MAAAPPKAKPTTKEWRKWEGVNVRDSRTAIGDTELAWMENAMTIGAGAIQILPGPGAPVATLSQGIASLWGATLNGLPTMLAVGLDGSLTEVSPFGSVTTVAPASTVSVNANPTMWRGSPRLIIDPAKGYFSWDGTTFTTLDASQKGEHIAVFQGRVWISKGRAIVFTAPNSFSDLSPGNGGGATNITDEAFAGNIYALASALEQLWIVGASAVEALSNVTAFGTPPAVFTNFSISNVVSSVGSQFSSSVIGYFRALLFASPFGVYALSGVTPQKISEKLDDFPFGPPLAPVPDVPAAVAVIQNSLAVCFLVSYAGNLARSGAPPVSIVACFSQGKWFFGSQGPLIWITTLVVNGVSQAWGTDGTNIYQLFGASTCTPVSYKIMSKLYDHGSAVTEKALMKLGAELRAQPALASQNLLCILNNPILGGTLWTLEPDTRPNIAIPVASVFVSDLTIWAFHSVHAVHLVYDISTDGGQTFPTTNATASASVNDVIGARTLVLGNGTTRVLLLLNDSLNLGYSDTVASLPTSSTWTTVTTPSSTAAPMGFEVNGLNVVMAAQANAAALNIDFSTDGGVTWAAAATQPPGAGTVATPLGTQVLCSPVAGTWLLINPSSGKIWRSTDSGNHWGAVVKTITAGDVSLPAVACIFAVNATRIVAVYKGQVSTSDDAGLTWTDRQNLTLVANSPLNVKQGGIGFIASFGTVTSPPILGGATNWADEYTLPALQGAMWRSTDNGTTWTIVNATGHGSSGTSNMITSFAARNGRGLIDIWNSGNAARNSWNSQGVAGAPVCMTLVNNAGAALTISHGTAGCPPQAFLPQLTADSETQSVPVPIYGTNGTPFLVNNVGALLTLLNNAGAPLSIISGGLSLSKADAKLFGHYLGWTLQGTDPPFRVETMEMEYALTRDWDTSP